jgi:hypothetical protein
MKTKWCISCRGHFITAPISSWMMSTKLSGNKIKREKECGDFHTLFLSLEHKINGRKPVNKYSVLSTRNIEQKTGKST